MTSTITSLTRSLRGRLLGLVAVAILPMALFALAGAVLQAQAQRTSFERSLQETVQALHTAVQNELNRSVAVAQALAASPLLARGELEAFYGYARTVLQREKGWLSLTLLTPDGRYIFNTRLPYGSALPFTVADPAAIRAVAQQQEAGVGNLLVGRVSREPVFTVRAPVVVGGTARYVLSAAVSPETLRTLLAAQAIPGDATAAILDRAHATVARSRDHQRYLGQRTSDSMLAIMGERLAGSGHAQTLEGDTAYAAFRTSPANGWSVAIGMPERAAGAGQRRAYGVLLLGLAASLALGGIAAYAVARGILRPVDRLRHAAGQIGRGPSVPAVDAGVAELRELAAALAEADRSVREAVTLREQVLEAEQHARSLAERSNREKDEFLAMLSHELRNPLAAIGNSLALLRRPHLPAAAQVKAHEILQRQFAHVNYLVDDLLDVSRLTQGKIVLTCEPLALHACVEDALRTLEQSGVLAAHRLETELEPVPVRGDAHRLQQVVNNLVGNAAKYSPAGTRIRVTLHDRDGHAELAVTDEGMGMDAATAARVFELFYQAPRARGEAQGGLGVGLSLAQRLVELHGGTIAVTSPGPGQGCRFVVRLPRVEVRAAA